MNKSIKIHNRFTNNRNNSIRPRPSTNRRNTPTKVITTALTKRGLRVQLSSNNRNGSTNLILAQNGKMPKQKFKKNKLPPFRNNRKLKQNGRRPPQNYNRNGYQNGLNNKSQRLQSSHTQNKRNTTKARHNTKKTGLLQWRPIQQNTNGQQTMPINNNGISSDNQTVSSIVSAPANPTNGHGYPQNNNSNTNNREMITVLVPRSCVRTLFGSNQTNGVTQATTASLSERFDQNPYL